MFLRRKRRPSDHSEEQTATQEIGRAGVKQLHQALVGRWVKTLGDAEWKHAFTHPTYVSHSNVELTAFVEQSIRNHRTPSHMVAELLAEGARFNPAIHRNTWSNSSVSEVDVDTQVL